MSRLKAVAVAVALVAVAVAAARRFPARQDPASLAERPQVATTGEPDRYSRPPLGVLGPAPCGSPLPDGPCALRLGHPLGPEMPGGGHLP